MSAINFHTGTALSLGLRELLQRLEAEMEITSPVNVYLAGGMAVHLYTAGRVTTDVDAEFASRLFFPKDLMVEVVLEGGQTQILYLDTNYSPSFALMHEDYQEAAIPLELGLHYLRVHVLTPVDIAVSKIARLATNDREDIAALVGSGLTTATAIEQRATQAMAGYVGGQSMLRLNIRDAVAIAREEEHAEPDGSGLTP